MNPGVVLGVISIIFIAIFGLILEINRSSRQTIRQESSFDLETTSTRIRVEVNGEITVEHEFCGRVYRKVIPAYNSRRIAFLTGNTTKEYWDVETRTEFNKCGGER